MRKIYILYIATISILSLVYINNTSALDYSSNVGIGFTFNPTLSVSLSSSDLVIPNLIPGNTLDSNSINVSVATNAAYGYTLSATVDDSLHNNTNLTHTNNTDIFSSIATNADLASLDTDNTWGYTSKLSSEITWNNYNGLSSSSNTVLLDANNNNNSDNNNNVDSINFKISAKASNTQPSGEYTGTINFIAVSKVAPMSLLGSFIASGAKQLNGYYKMQDMTHDICNNVDIEESELQLIDVRDNKIYWVAKLKDGNCWMTQNLDLDLSHEVALTSETSDIDPESYGTTIYTADTGYTKDEETGVVAWLPERSTVATNNLNSETWVNSNTGPYSYNQSNRIYYPNYATNINSGYDYSYTLYECIAQEYIDCGRYQSGNYYNWPATVASNDSGRFPLYKDADNSICPKNWRPPKTSYDEFGKLTEAYKIYQSNALDLRRAPLYFIRSGYVNGGSFNHLGNYGFYWSSTNNDESAAGRLYFSIDILGPTNYWYKSLGLSLRCMAK